MNKQTITHEYIISEEIGLWQELTRLCGVTAMGSNEDLSMYVYV